MTSWRQERRPAQRIERLTVGELLARAGREPELQILDVRERHEWEDGHIPGAAFEPWHDIARVPAGLDPERPIAVICASGQRASTGASLLSRAGARRVIHVVDGGVGEWARLGGPIEASAAAGASTGGASTGGASTGGASTGGASTRVASAAGASATRS